MSNQNHQHKIIGHYIVYAQLKLASPLQIASGNSDNSDKDMLLFYNNADSSGVPYIPAASITGALYHHYKKIKSKSDGEIEKYFWGDKDKDGKYQSHFVPEDLMCFDEGFTITRRDGVKINPKTGAAEIGAKYDYEILEPRLTFHFKAEMKARALPNIFAGIENQIAAIRYCFEDDSFRIGANTNNGFGKLQLVCFKVWRFDYVNNNDDANKYFNYLDCLNTMHERNLDYYQCFPEKDEINLEKYSSISTANTFSINATFQLKSSLIIGGSGATDDTDKPHLQSLGKNIISGKSLRGAIRHRAGIISDHIKMATEEFTKLFGEKGEKENSRVSNRGKKAKLQIEETLLNNTTEKQTRIKINRFTGGTIDTALFDSAPVWASDNDNGLFTIRFTISEATAKEKIILMHILKDLWNGDLPVGGEKNVGRGVLQGVEAEINDGDAVFIYPQQKQKLAEYFKNIKDN